MKSNVSDHLEMMHAVYSDACIKCTAEVSDLRDLETIRSRVEKEGFSFLTITLPNFCKDFERSLEIGYIDPSFFRGFPLIRKNGKSGAIPAFLQGMLGQLFNRETGRLNDETHDSPTVVESIRQVCLVFKKVEMPCTPERDNKAIASFIDVEHANSDFTAPEDSLPIFESVSYVLWADMLADLCLHKLVPKHGPGATAEHISGNGKYVWREWYERLEPYFPFFDNALSISAYEDKEALELVTFCTEEQERPVKVTLVPKTLKAPRIIAIEPVCMQYAQQAIRSFLYEKIESSVLTSGHVNFRDQTANQKLALISSKTGRYATIDLSDASDRVPWSMVKVMFASSPDFLGAVEACRSTGALLPDGRVIRPLHKFASMGSALCFPVESMYFYTLCVVALLRKRKLPVTRRNVIDVKDDIHVYGDDIIVPTNDADAVLSILQQYNCKVNLNKSFWTGKFRESCGVDAYMGLPVTPVYIRQMRPKNWLQAKEIISWVATANLFYRKGYWRTASLMFCTIESIVGSLPYVSERSPALGRISFMGYRSISKWNSDLFSWETKGLVPTPVYSCDNIDGYSALQKCLLLLEHRSPSMDEPVSAFEQGQGRQDIHVAAQDLKHLERSVRRGAVTLKRRGVPAL
ncbi:RNA-directed RNA polymerase [ssRNA phage Gephyllon.3_6]|uniref:RNA-directed RNA polymerase n=2 Tax=Leviviricetes TaxID=2842243 RepID=A0A8S5L162_9VIRU|nr:RNA-directed RNA polymerase [ssRNA phage Gephyllon.3_6]QDH87463.1 MAG: RNA-dependent RNA polymerase [Leviviridae sp.]DAD51328.1 TPA_asm: RNA-directed RNA polymerase [ssRNA phage Gephyllon.3_6]